MAVKQSKAGMQLLPSYARHAAKQKKQLLCLPKAWRQLTCLFDSQEAKPPSACEANAAKQAQRSKRFATPPVYSAEAMKQKCKSSVARHAFWFYIGLRPAFVAFFAPLAYLGAYLGVYLVFSI
jgi:hypothetical protein